MNDLIEIIQVLVLITLIILAYFAANADVVRKIFFRIKMRRKASKLKNSMEFEEIYDNAISGIDMVALEKEHIKNFSSMFFKISMITIPLILMFLFPYFVYELPDLAIPILIISPIMLIVGAANFKIPKKSKYIKEIIKNLIMNINSSIKIHENERKFLFAYNHSTLKFKEELRKIYDICEVIEYQSESDSNVKFAKLITKEISRSSHIVTTTEGIMIKIERNKIYDNEILIEMNKFFKRNNRVKANTKDEFEKYFDLYSLDEENAGIIINSEVRDELVRIYKEYGIMFEILLKENDIYIRILSGELFKTNAIGLAIINKKKFCRDYIIIRNIMQISERIDRLF